MSQFATNAIIYGIGTIAIVLLLRRYSQRKARERLAAEAARPAQAAPGIQTAAATAADAAAVATASTAAASTATASTATASTATAAMAASEPDVEGFATEGSVAQGPGMPGAGATASPTSHFTDDIADFTTAAHRDAFAHSPFRKPAVFNTLGKKTSPDSIPLPLVEAGETPLASPDDYVFGALTPALAALLPDSEERRAQAKQELKNAGFYQPYALQNLAAIRYLCIMFPLLMLGALLLFVPPRAEKYVVGAIVLLPAFGWALPRLYVKGKATERTSQIERAMPDMLDMLNMCVSQGMTVPAALKRVSQDLPGVHPALYKELQIVTEQTGIGTLRHALENFNKRIDVPEVHSFTTLLIQTERMGTSVSSALADYSDNMRESLKQRADEKGNQAAFKLLFPTVLCLMPAIYMFLLGPSIVELSNFFQRDVLNLSQANDIIQRTGQQPNRAP